MTANHSDHDPSDREREWMDASMGEIQNPNTLDRIRQQLEQHPEWQDTHSNLDQTIQLLRKIYPNKRNPMIDLTLEQKKELYSRISDLQIANENPSNQWLQHLKIFAMAIGSATLLLATVPLVQWISMPNRPTNPMDADNRNIEIPTPEVIVVPPIEPVPTEQDEPHEKIDYRPDINQLTYPENAIGLPGYGNVIQQFDLYSPSFSDDFFNVLDVDVIPTPTRTVSPTYPAEQRQSRTEGKVILEFVVDERGAVSQVKVLQSTHSAFNQPAVDAMRKWAFEPGLKDGKPVKVRMRIPLIFNIKS